MHGRIAKSLYLMGIMRKVSTKYYYDAAANGDMVQKMSILLVIIIMASSAIQVFFLKYMFKSVLVTPTQKHRA